VVIKRENYINIQGWMVTELGLKGNSLLIYAIIYGFSQEEGQQFSGSLQYLADWTNSTRRGVLKNLQDLVNAGLIEKENTVVNGVKFCAYRRTKFIGGVEQSSLGRGTEFTEGAEQSSPNNLLDNASNNLANKKNKPDKPAPRPSFAKPTLDEVRAYCEERQRTKGTEKRNPVDPERFFAYYESNGWKVGRNAMKDWRAAVRTWERNSFSSKPEKQASSMDYGSPEDFYR
jgi:hypothetical protein